MRGLAMSDATESDDERPCLHCLIGDVIDDFYAEYGSLSGEKDTIDVDEIITALAKTVAEMTFGSDAALRQRILEDLTREISQFEGGFADGPPSEVWHWALLSAPRHALSDREGQRWRPIDYRCRNARRNRTRRDMPPPAVADGAGLTYLRELLNRHLQVLGWPECDFLARFDLDGFSGRRVSSHAGGALPDLQDAKSRNPDPL